MLRYPSTNSARHGRAPAPEQDVNHTIDRREYERFAVSPMYTPIRVRLLSEEGFTREGHAYDVSEGGVRFELDEPVEAGTPVAMQIELPRVGLWSQADTGPGRAVFVIANVVWCDTEEPGPAKMAAAITRYARAGDKQRLLRQLSSGQFLRAA